MSYAYVTYVPYLSQVSYPLCTIASKPRLPEHCIEYVRVLQWSKEKPFSGKGPLLVCCLLMHVLNILYKGESIDGDNPDHMLWIYEKAQQRAAEYGIEGVNYRLTQGTCSE